MSEFTGLNTALSALQSQRRGLELAAQNVANANTDGYTRQSLNLVNIGAPAQPAIWSTFNGDGGGVKVQDVTRFRDQFMEIQAALEHGAAANLSVGSTTMQAIQQLFHEPGDNGIQQQLSDFWAGWDDVANHPADTASRTQLLERAQTVVSTFNTVSDQLNELRRNTTSQLGATIANVNTLADQVAQLNKTIKANSIAGLGVNDLLDQRDLLANKLAEAAGASLRSSGSYHEVSVVLNGTALVEGDTAQHLTLDASGAPNVTVRWQNTNAAAVVNSGTMGGEVTAINSTIGSYITQLDGVATSLRDAVNEVHSDISGSIAVGAQDMTAQGAMTFQLSLNGASYATATVTGADWSGPGGAAALQTALQNSVDTAIGTGKATIAVTGGNGSPLSVSMTPTATNAVLIKGTNFADFFGNSPVGTDGVGGRQFFTGSTAGSLALSTDVNGNPNGVAAGKANGGALDGSVALDFADFGSAATGADSTYRQMIVQVGVDAQTAQTRNDIQQKSMASLDNSRQSYSGVNTDEEMTYMVQYQHAYEAAARFMTAIDSLLDTLINHTAV